jgi:N-acetylglucosaminyldiphosphoundecaprenol N-acetyl-beta-D-mannosaminyltransferase
VTGPNYIDVLGFKVFSDNLDFISIKNSPAKVINTISPNSYGITTKDEAFCKALKDSDYLVLDGVYFAFASILLQGKNIKKNQGPDVFDHFLNRAIAGKKKVFFLGSTLDTLEKIKLKLNGDHPDVEVMYYSPPFKNEFNEDDNNQMLEAINSFKPDILFVGMTCPKQEKWAIKHREEVSAGLIVCIGNVFDWYSGNQKAIHPVWYKMRLAWLIRIFLRPEIFRRNIGNQMKFFADVLLIFLRLKKIQNA